MTDATDRRLAAQYEAYPYPARDPREEAKRLIVGSPSHLREVDHWIFGARRPASAPLRALVAGGGTGDGAIMLAQQMAWAGGRARWSGSTAAAPRAASPRPGRRRGKLDNVRFEEGSILDLPGAASAPSTTSTAAACCTTCPTRWPGCGRWPGCWPPAAGSA